MASPADFYRSFAGSEKLIAKFGRWPDFHDAEVLSFELHRDAVIALDEPVALVVIAPTQMEPEALAAEDAFTVTLRFFDVRDLRMAGFNHRNPILGLQIVPSDATATLRLPPPPLCEVAFLGVNDTWFCASFTCTGVTH